MGVNSLLILGCGGVWLVRLAGFEPATRCLEDAAHLPDVVCYLGK
jgi:hypothetical protein